MSPLQNTGRLALLALIAVIAPAVALLAQTTSLPTQSQPAVQALTSADMDKAEKQILIAVRSQSAFLRSNAIESGEYLPRRAASLVAIGMRDTAPAVRFAALAMLGKLQLRQLAPSAQQMLSDPDESVRAAAHFALYRCGERVDMTPMSALLSHTDPRIRANAAMLMGLTGDRSAIDLLREKAAQPLSRAHPEHAAVIRLQFAEAIVKLGDEKSLDAIRAGAFSQFQEVRVMAVIMLGRLGDRSMQPALEGLLANPPIELQLAAAEALARMGQPKAIDMVLQASVAESQTVRAQAAMALAHYRDPRAGGALARMMDDASAQVRIAASAAVLMRSRN